MGPISVHANQTMVDPYYSSRKKIAPPKKCITSYRAASVGATDIFDI